MIDFNLQENPTFADMKLWFEANRNDLQNTFQGDGIYYKDVKFTASKYIESLELRIQSCREQNIHPAKDRLAISGKNQLFRLYKDLQNLDQWNKSLPKFGKFSNRMNQ